MTATDSTGAVVWTCDECFAKWFPALADNTDRRTLLMETETGLHAAVVHIGCGGQFIEVGFDVEEEPPCDPRDSGLSYWCPHDDSATFAVNELGQHMEDVIMEGILGRPLADDEYVSHRNGNTLDNRRSNLPLCVRDQS
jgi:hypothetical protein